METDRERRERETVRLAEISNHASLYMGHRQWKIRWCCEMELLSFNPSNVPGDTHQITTEPSVHSYTDRGERTQADPHCPHCCSPLRLPSPPSFTPLMLHARRRSKRGVQTMEMWMRAHSVSCPPLFSDEVAQFMFALYSRCLPHVISVTSNSLKRGGPSVSLHCTRMLRAHARDRRGHLSVCECRTLLFFFFYFKKEKKAALDSSTVDEQALGDVLVQHCSACLSPSPLPLHRCASCHAWQ